MLLEVRDLCTEVRSGDRSGVVVDHVSFSLDRGQTLGLIGESGSGKSMTCLSLLGLNPQPQTTIVDGAIHIDGVDFLTLSDRERRRYRGDRISMILQDPMQSLNPVFSIGYQLRETLSTHNPGRRRELQDRAIELLRMVRIPDPERRLNAYPHELSGGMRQRVAGGLALACAPDILIADEPTTSLDVTVQAAYLRLLKRIQKDTNLAMLFVTHDLQVVSQVCDQIAVMYAGRIVEIGKTRDLLEQPAHPYTRALVNASSVPRSPRTRLPVIQGQPPSVFASRQGCPFANRCPLAEPRCSSDPPPRHVQPDGRSVECWRPGE